MANDNDSESPPILTSENLDVIELPPMLSQNAKKNRKRRRKAAALSASSASNATTFMRISEDVTFPMEKQLRFNLMSCGCQGCHIVDTDCPWIIGEREMEGKRVSTNPFGALEDEDDESCVELELIRDGESGVISVSNFSNNQRAVYISAQAIKPLPAKVALYDKHKRLLITGTTSNEQKQICACVTFIIKLGAHRSMDLAILEAKHLSDFSLSKLSFELKPHPEPDAAAVRSFSQFPLEGIGPFLCTQGCGGRLTHFFPESYHAFDLRCAVGTPVVALADGQITEINQQCDTTGCHCNNLTDWNSISMEIQMIPGVGDGPKLLLEYVHIAPGSCKVKVGDVVKQGQVLCLSGNVGFAPEPHVHIEAHKANDPRGPSVKIELVDSNGKNYIPIAGKSYNKLGLVNPPQDFHRETL